MKIHKTQKELGKENIFNWFKKNEKHLKETTKSMFINTNTGTITMKYDSGFTYELRWDDFPNRNLVPIYDMKMNLIECVHDSEPLPPLRPMADPKISPNPVIKPDAGIIQKIAGMGVKA